MSVGIRLTLVLGAVASCAVVARPIEAQGVRGTLTHTGFYAELRPLVQDTVPLSQVTPTGLNAWEFEGQPIFCQAEQCTRFRAGSVASTVSGSVDGSFTAWGLGMRGLSTTVSFRARGRTGGDLLWPRTDDRLDVFLAYAQLVRGPWRARVGRQRILGGLGRNAFDGGAVLWSPRPGWRVEAYGGRSLALGLAEPRNTALEGLENFFPDRNAYLFGGSLQGRPHDQVDLTLRYQREIWSDRSGLLSERASLDVRAYPWERIRVDGSVDWDFAFARVGKAELTAQIPLAGRSWVVETSASRYLPYFELWTIWGFFSPVPWHEGRVRVAWTRGPARAWISGAYRRYGDAETTVVLSPLEDTGRRAEIGGSWGGERWSMRGEYRVEWSAGAFFSGGDVGATWLLRPGLRLAANGTAFQQIQEFRVGEGTVWGGGVSVDADLPWQLGLSAGLSTMRAGNTEVLRGPDWNQLRGFWTLSVPIGADPGLAGRRLPGRVR